MHWTNAPLKKKKRKFAVIRGCTCRNKPATIHHLQMPRTASMDLYSFFMLAIYYLIRENARRVGLVHGSTWAMLLQN
ncbi:hypothetical protein BDA99DRAFT_517440, partial [Phascolomyces articulosus]